MDENVPRILLSDAKFDKVINTIVESYSKKIADKPVTHLQPEIVVLTINKENERGMIGSSMSTMPDDDARDIVFETFGYAICKATNSIPYAIILIAEAWINKSGFPSNEALVIRGATPDGRQKVASIFLGRDSDNNLIVIDAMDMSKEEENNGSSNFLMRAFFGVSKYIAERYLHEQEDTGTSVEDMDAIREKLIEMLNGKATKSPIDLLSELPKTTFSNN